MRCLHEYQWRIFWGTRLVILIRASRSLFAAGSMVCRSGRSSICILHVFIVSFFRFLHRGWRVPQTRLATIYFFWFQIFRCYFKKVFSVISHQSSVDAFQRSEQNRGSRNSGTVCWLWNRACSFVNASKCMLDKKKGARSASASNALDGCTLLMRAVFPPGECCEVHFRISFSLLLAAVQLVFAFSSSFCSNGQGTKTSCEKANKK